MKVELIYSPGCAKCLAARQTLRAAAEHVQPDIVWNEINVLDDLDYAVSLGVLTLPAMAIDGELVFPSLPTPLALEDAIRQRLQRSI